MLPLWGAAKNTSATCTNHHHLVVKEYVAYQLYSVYKTTQLVTKAHLFNQLLLSKDETIKHITPGPSLDNKLI